MFIDDVWLAIVLEANYVMFMHALHDSGIPEISESRDRWDSCYPFRYIRTQPTE